VARLGLGERKGGQHVQPWPRPLGPADSTHRAAGARGVLTSWMWHLAYTGFSREALLFLSFGCEGKERRKFKLPEGHRNR